MIVRWRRCHTPTRRLAVLAETRLFVFDPPPAAGEPAAMHSAELGHALTAEGLPKLATWSDRNSISAVWTTTRLDFEHLDAPEGWELRPMYTRDGVSGVQLRPIGSRVWLRIFGPLFIRAWLMDRAEPLAVGRALWHVQTLLGATIAGTPSAIACAVLQDELARLHYQQHIDVELLPADVLAVIQREMPGGGVQALNWCSDRLAERIPSTQEHVAVAAYDHRQSYLSAAHVDMPAGEPCRVSALCMKPNGWPYLGLYRVSAEAPPDFPDVPGPFWIATDDGIRWPRQVREVWAWTPQINLAARYFGWRVEVHEGWAWQDSHRYLSSSDEHSWRQRFINALRVLEPRDASDAQLAFRALKIAAVSGIGRLGAHWSRRNRPEAEAEAMLKTGAVRKIVGPAFDARGWPLDGQVAVLEDRAAELPLYLPHWRSQVIAEANWRLAYVAWKVAPQATIGAYTDSVYAIDRQPAIDNYRNKRGQPGGYRLKRLTQVPADELRACAGAWELAHVAKAFPEITAEALDALADDPVDELEADDDG